MTINPINPSSSDYYSSNQSSENIPGELTFAIESLEMYLLSVMKKSESPSVLMDLLKHLQILKEQVQNNQISPSIASLNLQDITELANEFLPTQEAYPTLSPPYGAAEQLEGLIAFLKTTNTDPKMSGQVQELLELLNDGAINPRQAMELLIPIINQFPNLNITYPIPNPSDYPS